MELVNVLMFILRIIFSYLISTYIGRKRNIGAEYSFWISLFLTPIVGIIITLCSSKFKGELPKRNVIIENIGIVIFLLGALVLLMTLGALLSNNSYLEPKFLYSMMFLGSGIFTLGLYIRQKGLGKSFADEYVLLSNKPLETNVNGNTLDYPEIVNFSISPMVVKSGDKITISWDVRKAIKVSISGLGTVELGGFKVFKIHNIHDVQTKIITLYAENDTGVKTSKDLTLKFKNPIKAQTTINEVESISLSKWFIQKIKQNKSSNFKILFSVLSIVIMLYYVVLFYQSRNTLIEESAITQSKPISKFKDTFYYDVSQYLRRKNPGISNEEVFVKADEFRKFPEEFYANVFKDINNGIKIDKRQLRKFSESINMKLDFDKIPVHLRGFNIEKYSTGEKPFADCFETMTQCYDNCSQITVIAPFNSDVVVTIKQEYQVIDHGYISESESFTFELENGTYQTFFYFGSGGWDVDKILTTTSCGELYGGFVTDEVFSKAQEENLNSTVLTYTLQLTKNGNFSTTPSSVKENF